MNERQRDDVGTATRDVSASVAAAHVEPGTYAAWAREAAPEIVTARAEDLGNGEILVYVAGAGRPVSAAALARARRALEVRAPLCVVVTVVDEVLRA